jgi:hypothetical protein
MVLSRKVGRDRKRDRACQYVGRFLWSFANVAAGIDEVFTCKFNLDAFSSLLMQHHLEIRKKIELIRFAFERQGVENVKTVRRILGQAHDFHDIRNAIAHNGFEHADSFTRIENGHKIYYPAGVEFDIVDRSGKMRIRDPFETRKKQRKQIERLKESNKKLIKDKDKLQEANEWADWLLDERTITYAQFDEFDAQMTKLTRALFELDLQPINEGVNFVQDVAKIIASSDNVFAFPRPPSER